MKWVYNIGIGNVLLKTKKPQTGRCFSSLNTIALQQDLVLLIYRESENMSQWLTNPFPAASTRTRSKR